MDAPGLAGISPSRSCPVAPPPTITVVVGLGATAGNRRSRLAWDVRATVDDFQKKTGDPEANPPPPPPEAQHVEVVLV